MKKIISSLHNNKSYGPNSIPTKIMKLQNDESAEIRAEIFSLSFKPDIFFDSFKISKIIPIHEKDSKLTV